MGLKINVECHNINRAKFILTIIPTYTDFRSETIYINKIIKEMATIYARLINHFKFENHKLFSAIYYKTDEKHQRISEIELFIKLNINHISIEPDIKNLDVEYQLEHQIQIQLQETKESSWIIDEISSMKTRF